MNFVSDKGAWSCFHEISSQSTWQIRIEGSPRHARCLAVVQKGSARNRDENRVRVDTDRSFVSIHPPWHLTSTARAMSANSSPLRSVAPRWPAGQPNMLIETILICLIAAADAATFSFTISSSYSRTRAKHSKKTPSLS